LMAGFPAPGYDGRPRDAAVGVRFHGPLSRPGRGTSSFLAGVAQVAA